MTEENKKSLTLWVDTDKVMPNPLNPRKDNSVDQATMQKIIAKRGWEEPLSAYKKGNIYVLLAGHRRHSAAMKANIKQVPVFVVPRPQSEQEEIERIGDLQAGRVNWTQYEWALYTYDLWKEWGKPSKTTFKDHINVKQAAMYITVLDHFPQNLVGDGLAKEDYNFSSLEQLIKWMKKVKKLKPAIIEDFTEEMIEKSMLNKIKKNKVTRDDLRRYDFISKSTDAEFREFLTDQNANLNDHIERLGLAGKSYDTFSSSMKSINNFEAKIDSLNPQTKKQRDDAINRIIEMQKLMEEKLEQLKSV